MLAWQRFDRLGLWAKAAGSRIKEVIVTAVVHAEEVLLASVQAPLFVALVAGLTAMLPFVWGQQITLEVQVAARLEAAVEASLVRLQSRRRQCAAVEPIRPVAERAARLSAAERVTRVPLGRFAQRFT